MSIEAVVSHHMNPFRSGVARFNIVLAEHLKVPVVSVLDGRVADFGEVLVSLKAVELDDAERAHVARFAEAHGGALQLYLHSWDELELERVLIGRSRRVLCGNHELMALLAGRHAALEVSWTPGLLLDSRRMEPAELTVFSFGMAHKLRIDHFRRLRELLDGTGSNYRVYVSAANHETATLQDAELIFREMDEVFPGRLYFLGNLSDLAVQHYLETSTFFAAFFDPAARANNTTVASALERGAVVLTNLDHYSPPEYVHMHNLIDVTACDALPDDPLILRQLSVEAMLTARTRRWDQLVAQVNEPQSAPATRLD